MEKFLTLKETAKILSVSEHTVMRYLIKGSKIGQWRIEEGI